MSTNQKKMSNGLMHCNVSVAAFSQSSQLTLGKSYLIQVVSTNVNDISCKKRRRNHNSARSTVGHSSREPDREWPSLYNFYFLHRSSSHFFVVVHCMATQDLWTSIRVCILNQHPHFLNISQYIFILYNKSFSDVYLNLQLCYKFLVVTLSYFMAIAVNRKSWSY